MGRRIYVADLRAEEEVRGDDAEDECAMAGMRRSVGVILTRG
jgi:hypothetical protein